MEIRFIEFGKTYIYTYGNDFSKINPEHACVPVVECLLAITQHYYLAAQPAVALPPASQAVDFSRRLSDSQLLRKALTFLGVMRTETGNLPGATESYSEALEVARTLTDGGAEAPVWNNLGLALQGAAQYSDALQCFERASALAQRSDQYAFVEKYALSNIASCALHLQDIRSGIKAVRKAIELNLDPQTASDCLVRVISESHYSRLLLGVGEVGHAASIVKPRADTRARALLLVLTMWRPRPVAYLTFTPVVLTSV